MTNDAPSTLINSSPASEQTSHSVFNSTQLSAGVLGFQVAFKNFTFKK